MLHYALGAANVYHSPHANVAHWVTRFGVNNRHVELVLYVEVLDGSRAAELDSAAGFDADDAILLVPVLVWVGWADWMIVGAALGAPAFALFMYVKFRARLNRSA